MTSSAKIIQFVKDISTKNEIYAPELSLTKETLCVKEASYLDLFIAAKVKKIKNNLSAIYVG